KQMTAATHKKIVAGLRGKSTQEPDAQPVTKVLRVTRARILGQQVYRVGCKEPCDSNDAGYQQQLPVFHGRKKVQETRAEMGSSDAVGISCDRQKWKDRCDANDLK